jgi:hypothetical protein
MKAQIFRHQVKLFRSHVRDAVTRRLAEIVDRSEQINEYSALACLMWGKWGNGDWIKLAVGGYRRHVELTDEELERLEAVMHIRPLYLGCLSYRRDQRPSPQAVRCGASSTPSTTAQLQPQPEPRCAYSFNCCRLTGQSADSDARCICA